MRERAGSQIGLTRKGTIQNVNSDGTITVVLDESNLTQSSTSLKLNFLANWSGPNGEFAGGFPNIGTPVSLVQGQGGEWFLQNLYPKNRSFLNLNSLANSSLQKNLMNQFKPERYLIQVKDSTCLFLDPNSGIQAGKPDNYLHLDPNHQIISLKTSSLLHFTQVGYCLSNIIRRDLGENSNRNTVGSTLDSHSYENTLFTIGLDPVTKISSSSSGLEIRNPALVEQRQIIYEFGEDYQIDSDEEEAKLYSGTIAPKSRLKNDRYRNRTSTLSLNLFAPNHLIETIAGTVVDTFGNVLDLNLSVIPLGRGELNSLRKNTNKTDAYVRSRALLKKSIAYHFGLNNRISTLEDQVMIPPNSLELEDYGRNESQFRFDIDKEGQFLLNVPASSNIGNLPLLIRHQTYSVLKYQQDGSISPKEFVRNVSGQDIFIKGFAGKAEIKILDSSGREDGYSAPLDYLTGTTLKYGTAFHDITRVCSEFQEIAGYNQAGVKLINFSPNNILNQEITPLPFVVSPSIIVSGEQANAGGRSGTITCDGFLNLNIGANTIDRQSLWLDCAGGIVSSFGRDKQNISWAANMDGDCFIQIGGPGIGNSFDSRFENFNDAYRNGTLDIRVHNNGQLNIFRISNSGVHVISPGKIVLDAQQDIIIKSNSNVKIEGELIMMYSESSKRIINKLPGGTTIG